jgi:hypothetical protein
VLHCIGSQALYVDAGDDETEVLLLDTLVDDLRLLLIVTPPSGKQSAGPFAKWPESLQLLFVNTLAFASVIPLDFAAILSRTAQLAAISASVGAAIGNMVLLQGRRTDDLTKFLPFMLALLVGYTRAGSKSATIVMLSFS